MPKRQPRRRDLLVFTFLPLAGFLAWLLVGVCFALPVPTPGDPGDGARNLALRNNLNVVRTGLEQYCNDHGGRYPSDAEFPRVLCQNEYLPGNHLPGSPWARPGLFQTNALSRASLPGGDASAWPPPGTRLGPSRVPDSDHFLPLDLGAIYYEALASGRHYVVHGIGRDRGSAVLF